MELELFIYAPADTEHKKPVGIVFDSLARHSKTDWKVWEFFTAIGSCKYNQAIVPKWDMVSGATGRAVFCPEIIEGKMILKVKRYMDPEEVLMKISA